MTICIAAECQLDGESAVILCSDWAGTSSVGSSQTMVKVHWINRGVRCLAAGEEPDITRLLHIIRAEVHQIDGQLDEANILPTIQKAIQKRISEKIDSYLVGEYGMTFSEFRNNMSSFPPDLYRSEFLLIKDLSLGAELIVVSFIGRFPYLVHVSSNGRASIREDYVCIGSGAMLAAAVLTQREYTSYQDWRVAVYKVWEAKKYAERIPTVGTKTSISVLRSGGGETTLFDRAQKQLDEYYKKFGPKKIARRLTIDPKNIGEYPEFPALPVDAEKDE